MIIPSFFLSVVSFVGQMKSEGKIIRCIVEKIMNIEARIEDIIVLVSLGSFYDIFITFPLLQRTLARKLLIPPACTEPVYREMIKT